MTYLKGSYGTKRTSQSEKIPGTAQVENSAGGYVWTIDDWKRLDRFLVLGSEGGTYYTTEHKLTRDNVEAVTKCIETDGVRVVNRIVEVSEAGRAPKNDPALFALAMCAGIGDDRTRKVALEALPRVARIGTHLFHFASYVEEFRGWGRGLRAAVGDWYNKKGADTLSFQVVKYQERDGWSNADLLRLSHPVPVDEEHKDIFKWIVDSEVIDTLPRTILGFEKAKKATTEREIVSLTKDYKLTREMIPTKFLTVPGVQTVLLPNLGYAALIRNLGNMSKSGLLGRGQWNINQEIVSRITNPESIKKSRIHPIGILTALLTYSQGHGIRGKGEWEVVQDVVDALDTAFYTSFGNVEPTGKRLVLALDVSGSMSWGTIAGVEGLTPRLASAAMAMVTYKAEGKVVLVSFQEKMVELDIGRCSRLTEVEKSISDLEFGMTDCSLPMLWAIEKGIEADAFVIYTDNETWYGDVHPAQALNDYRRKLNIPAKLVVVGMTATEFSIADPRDSGMLDVVGFDSATPEVMRQYIVG